MSSSTYLQTGQCIIVKANRQQLQSPFIGTPNLFATVRRFAIACCLSLFGFSGICFAEPVINSVSPQAVRPGETTLVTVNGTGLTGTTGLWMSCPGDVALAPESEEQKSSDTQLFFQINIPDQTSTGLHGVRLVSPSGISALKPLIVDPMSSVAQAAGNRSLAEAQAIKLPTAIDGVLAALESRYYRFTAEAGQKVCAEVFARRIGSSLDPMLRLLSANGRELTYADDTLGLGGDLQLSYEIQEAGDYFIEIRDIQYRGSASYNYRLRIGDFPCLQSPFPLVAQRGQTKELAFSGLDVADVVSQPQAVPTDPNLLAANVSVKRTNGTSTSWVSLALSDSLQFLETEPNNQVSESNATTLGQGLNGRLQDDCDVDRFRFSATKGQKYRFAARTRSLGTPTDLYLQIEDAAGKRLAAVDDTGTGDGQLTYTFPADGEYVLAVHDLNHRGGSQFVYHVDVTEAKPTFVLQAAVDRLNIPAGGTFAVTVNVTRLDYGGPIELKVNGLPEGATSVPTIIGNGQNLAVLTVQVSTEFTAGTLSHLEVVGEAKLGEDVITSRAVLTDTLKTQWANAPFIPLHLANAFASAVIPAAPFNLNLPATEVVFGPNLTASFKVTINRSEAIDEAVVLALLPDDKNLPPGVTVKVNPVAKGASEAVVELTATDKAPLGDYTVTVQGTHTKKGQPTVVQPAPGVRVRLAAPLTAVLSVEQPVLSVGNTLKAKVVIQRNPALAGEATLTFQNLPQGVTLPAVTIPADQSEVEIVLTAAADAAVGVVKNLSVKADIVVDKKTFSATSPAVALDVQPAKEVPAAETPAEKPES